MQNQYIAKKIDEIGFVVVQKCGRHSETGSLTCNENFRMMMNITEEENRPSRKNK